MIHCLFPQIVRMSDSLPRIIVFVVVELLFYLGTMLFGISPGTLRTCCQYQGRDSQMDTDRLR